MASPLSKVAGTIGKAMGGVFYPATLSHDTRAAGANDWTPGAVTTTSYVCKALPDTWGAYHLANGLVAATDAKIIVLASTLTIQPQAGDRVTVQGSTYTIVADGGSKPAVETDPAQAVWVCRGRK